ncbi:TPA: response regulator [Stenotrophomonas maltophilia]|uniref:Response regulator n=1 Tax=Stenotrophomonas maltophilia TaxID=40324 RepID=A0AAJ2JB33_STEMA|nr:MULTISPECIES: response regulator [Stenotrophomonas]MBH1362693.1 response regulator [Stenotrophomonas maltophilia]MDQ7279459.1 response regulator [Stenotrophomonas sp. Sm6012]MDT3468400.1 response regulator [Stenotrophomonas maltophilia]HDS1123160.1 response regulator [Stenotrophomonas maltophilia]HEL3178594.1 response regulator [Stenotrophomonas maltophilia]
MHPESRPHTCNLLLVEDQFDLANLMEQALQQEGDQVTHAYSVFDALELLDTRQFDGAVLDVELRDGVVFPVADRLAELGVPYLFVSAVYDQLVPARHRGAPFVAKPFHLEKLQRAVQHAISGSRATGSAGPDSSPRNQTPPRKTC